MTFQVNFCAQEASGSGQQKPSNVPIFEKNDLKKSLNHQNNAMKCTHIKKREKVRQRGRESEKSFPETVLTVGSRVCSKVSFLWSNSCWWGAVDTRCTANTLRATRNRWLSSRSGRRWDAGILHTRICDDIQSLGKGRRVSRQKERNRPESRTAISDNW